eukprot:CAMPEP_0171207988 /NCGR_PEP_ID=MMETSP0790-20130122/27857_1 /TAXON_ID=2925 /ORGANISM="Alexandrium catenella, Strain OF101" /LENGTH=506 /DNA_ID=CAMNT_0011673571 /DNA_START=117 /DNA_END=1637 /DNA_ORIENTATION=-
MAAVTDLMWSMTAELAIFLVTLAFAFAISGASGVTARKQVKGKQCLKARPHPDEGGGCTSPTAAPEARPRAPSRRAVEAEAGKPAAPGADPKAARRVWKAAQLMESIIDGVREHPAARFAPSALEKYGELKAILEEDGIRVAEVERSGGCARQYTGLDLYSTLVLCISRSAKYFLIEGLLDDMAHFGVGRSLNFYESAMKQFAGQKQYHLALFLYDRLVLDGLQPSTVTCSCLISFAAEVGKYQCAIGFFKKLAAQSTPSIRAYMTVLRVYGKLQDWPSSMQTLRDMQTRRVPIDTFVVNVILATGVAADELNGVEALVAEMAGQRRSVLDIVSYNILVKGYAQRNDFENVMEVANRMRERGLVPSSITFNSIMDAAVRSHRITELWALLSEMRSTGLRPDKYTASILVKSLSASPQPLRIEGALQVLMEVNDVCDVALRSTLYHAIFEATAQTGSASLLERVFAQMRRVKVVPTVAMVRYLNECSQASNADACWAVEHPEAEDGR